ncbi:MAG TPA: hypothetical protein VNJ03_12520 [Vicinamibacterales bacterium]|nr:hypothetical protein [Vicinamibacterales bacterium]
MPKPVKKPVRTPIAPAKPKRPIDPNRAAHAMLAEHMARVQAEPAPAPQSPLDFAVQYKAHMAKLGAKGGKIGGKLRMDSMTDPEKSALGLKAATARWAKVAEKKR